MAIDLSGTSYRAEAGKDGGSVVIGDWQEATQFNPYYLGQGSEPAVASAAWATLVTVTHDHRYVPDLATRLPTVENGGVQVPGDGGDAMTVSWTLREGLKWSDGESLTCDDFKYAWEWVLDKNNVGVVTAGFEDVKSVECRSDTEMVWHFQKVYEGYLTLMTAPLPRHYLGAISMQDQTEGVGFRREQIAKLPVNGPFKFDSVTPATDLRLSRNPNYTSPRTGTPAHLDSLVFRWYADAAALIAGYRKGEIKIASGLADTDLPKLVDLGEQVSTRRSLTYETLRPNWSGETCSANTALKDRGPGCPMADPKMRKAVALAIDRTAIAARTPGGTEQLPGTNVDPLDWFYAQQPAPTFDPVAATQILDAAGWTDVDGDGIREMDGLQARIELCTTADQAQLNAVALVAASLKDVGIEVLPRQADPADMFAAYDRSDRTTPCGLERGNFDLALDFLASSIDPGDFYLRYHSSQVPPYGQNDARVDDVGIDVALDAVRGSAHPAVVRDGMVEFQRIYVDQTVEIPIYFEHVVELHAADLGNYVGSSPVGGPTWNVADWFIKG